MSTQLIVNIKNPSRYYFPYASVFCVWHNADGDKEIYRKAVILKPASEARISFDLKAEHCGIFNIGISRLAVRDIWGLFYVSRYNREHWQSNVAALTVIPLADSRNDDWAEPSNWPIPGQAVPQQVSPELDTLANLRDYRAGDSQKRIHWKLSARLNKLYVKEFEDPKKRYVCFSIDSNKPVFIEQNDYVMDWTLESTAAVMKAFIDNKRQIKWLDTMYTWQIEEALRPDQFDLLRQSMSHFSWSGNSWTEHLFARTQQQPVDLLVLISWQPDQELADWLDSYLKQKGKVMLMWLQSKQRPQLESETRAWEKILEAGVFGYILEVADSK